MVSHVLYKVGEESGFFAVLNAPDLEQAKAMAEAGTERLELFDLEVVSVNQFPHFPEGDVLNISSLTSDPLQLWRGISFRTCLRGLPSAGRGQGD